MITRTRLAVSGTGHLDPDEVRKAITPATKLIATVQASNVTGVIQPTEVLGLIAREHGALFLLDAAQTIGVVDIDVQAMNIDLLAFPGHKSLNGPTGTGGLYVSERAELSPFREGGTGADSVSVTQPTEFPTWLEAGTPNTVGLAGLNAALDELKPSETLVHELRLLERLAGGLADERRIRIVGDWSSGRCVGVMSLVVEGMTANEAAVALDESFGIAVRPGLHCAPYIHRAIGTFPDGTIRVSPGWASEAGEIDRFTSAIRRIAGR
jgi:selenocysteine lyase/cysteine desulfurase